MNEALNIYVDRLMQGKVEEINRPLSPGFLDVDDPDLSFESDVLVQGEVYIAGEGLVFHLNISTIGKIPCSICNEICEVPIQVKGFYHVEPLENIRSGIFNMSGVIRENIILEMPSFVECHGGNCPQRKEFKKYLKKESSSHQLDSEEEGYHPFSDLE